MITPLVFQPELLPAIVDSELAVLMDSALRLAAAHPGIEDRIDADRDAYALKKKGERVLDEQWLNFQGKGFTGLNGYDLAAAAGWADDLRLEDGRPRIPALFVFLSILFRGYFGGLKERKSMMLVAESKTMELLWIGLGLDKMPGASTLSENANAVSRETLDMIHRLQLASVKAEGLDDFLNQTYDSTGVEANSAFPQDSALIMKLVIRAEKLLRSLDLLGITLHLPSFMADYIATIRNLNKEIQLSSGKKNSEKMRKKLYRKMMKLAKKVNKAFAAAHTRATKKSSVLNVMPSIQRKIDQTLDWINVDIHNIKLTVRNTDLRINQEEKVAAEEKVVSVSDESAALIVKGNRPAIIGYRPQIGRSANGFVIGLIVPEGNANDAGQLRPIVDAARANTGVKPDVLSFDDGYSNAADRDYYLSEGVGVVSFSGSKGKHIIPEEIYNSKPYVDARNMRSAIESLMFTLKDTTDFGELARRGIESVRSELLEKAVVYNLFRAAALSKARAKKLAA